MERQQDSVRKGIPVVLTTGLILVNEHNHPLLLLKCRLRLTEGSLMYSKKSSEERAQNRHEICGTLQYAQSTSLNPDASMVASVISDTLRLVGSPVKCEQ